MMNRRKIEKMKLKQDYEGLVAVLFHEKSGDLRLAAVAALYESKQANSIYVFIKALQDEYFEVRGAAAFALGELRDARVVKPLLAALQDEHEKVRRMAVFALGKIKNPLAEQTLQELSENGPEDVRMIARGVLMHKKMGLDPYR